MSLEPALIDCLVKGTGEGGRERERERENKQAIQCVHAIKMCKTSTP